MSEYKRKTWVEGEVIDARCLNNIETGIVEAKKEAENAAAKAQSAAKGLIKVEPVTIPATGWETDEASGFMKRAIRNCAVTGDHIVDINLDLPSLAAAEDCGMKSVTQSYDGGVYIYAEEPPYAVLTGTLVVMCEALPSSGDEGSGAVPANALVGADGVYLTVQEG